MHLGSWVSCCGEMLGSTSHQKKCTGGATPVASPAHLQRSTERWEKQIIVMLKRPGGLTLEDVTKLCQRIRTSSADPCSYTCTRLYIYIYINLYVIICKIYIYIYVYKYDYIYIYIHYIHIHILIRCICMNSLKRYGNACMPTCLLRTDSPLSGVFAQLRFVTRAHRIPLIFWPSSAKFALWRPTRNLGYVWICMPINC